MRTKRIILITAGIFVVIGMIVSGIAARLIMMSTDNSAQKITKEITDKITKLDISVNMGDIKIITADTDKITLQYLEDYENKYELSSSNGTLSFKYLPIDKNNMKWYDYFINIDFHSKDYYNIIMTVPKNFSADSVIKSRYGDVEVSGIAGSLDIDANCGDISVLRCEFSEVKAVMNAGDIEIEQVTADSIIAENNCGDIEAENIAGNLNFKCNYGDIQLERVSGNNITLESDCGDIEGTILGDEADYTVNSSVDMGKNKLGNRSGGKNILYAKTDMGNIDIKFVK